MDSQPTPQNELRDRRPTWFDRGLLLAVLLACAVAVSPNLADPDLWGHVQYGLDVFEDGEIPATTRYAFTVDNFRWINHENLSELILATGAITVGGVGLLIMKCLLGVAVIGMVMRHARRQGAQLVTVAGLALLLAVNLTYHWSVRPQIFSYALFAALLALLSWCFSGWEGHWHLPWLRRTMRAGEKLVTRLCLVTDRTRGSASHKPAEPARECAPRQSLGTSAELPRLRWLWLAPVIFFVWANTHGGFAAGYCIFAGILGCRAIEAVAVKGRRAKGLVHYLVFMIVVSGLATLVNPYGPQLHAWVFQSLSEPRPEISEWHGLGWNSPHLLPFVLLVATAVAALLASRRPLDFTHLALLSLILWQAVEHQRHIPFFALAAGFWLPRHIESLFTRWRKAPAGGSIAADLTPTMRRVLCVGLLCAYGLLAFRLCGRLHTLRVERDEYPVAALQYMVDHDLHGRLVVTFNWAQYAIAALKPFAPEPGVQVACDGRFRTCYPQEIVDMHFDFLLGDDHVAGRHRSQNSPPIDGARSLRFGNPELVLIDRVHPHSADVMRAHAREWVLLYQDSVAEVWGRADLYDNRRSADYFPPHKRVVDNTPQAGAAAWPALPVRRAPQSTVAMN